jgi:hypothetical protein
VSILIEALSVVIRRDAIDSKYPGGWGAFRHVIPNEQWCADDYLVRVGFMHPGDVRVFVTELEANGLVFNRNGTSVDIAVIDQSTKKSTVPTPWLRGGEVHIPDGGMVTCCELVGAPQQNLSVPAMWNYASSLSASYARSPVGAVDEWELVNRDEGVHTYRHRQTGVLRYVPVLPRRWMRMSLPTQVLQIWKLRWLARA